MGHHGPVRHRYGVVETRAWDLLSGRSPLEQLVVLRLLTGPERLPIPGVARVGRAALAEALGQPLRAVERALAGLETAGALIADWPVRLVWVRWGAPDPADAATSTAVAASWRRVLDDLPACALREQIDASLRGALGEGPIAASYAAGKRADRGLPARAQPQSSGADRGLPDPDPDPDPDPEEERGAPPAAPPPLALVAPPAPRLTLDAAQQVLARASGGRYVASPLKKGPAITVVRWLAAQSDPEAVLRRIGEWLWAGGDAWRGTLDGRHLGDLDAWAAQSAAWDAAKRPPIEAQPRRRAHGHGPVADFSGVRPGAQR